ncbi:surface protein [Lentilactobacillus fungorum]|uniref:Surface protein n=1 Tax=Lentilactobacillus fungorum TaxID=2201250 RepID=A0ABQ3W0U8_9LACO|nr:DUF5776 domain-containing protein [Lentilactobacillus fungorum]GHP14795.1 surface protein [Lentilactobacillus fungorum]
MNNDSQKNPKGALNKVKASKFPTKRIVATILFSAALGTMSAVGPSQANFGGFKGGAITALADTAIDWDQVGTVQNDPQSVNPGNVKDNFSANNMTGTNTITPNGTSVLTSGDNNDVGYMTSNYRLDFNHDFEVQGFAKFGTSWNDNRAGGDAFNFLFSQENPNTLKPGSGVGGLLGMAGLHNAFGLVFDEHYNEQDGDFKNDLGIVLANDWKNLNVASWRTTNSDGNVNSNARTGSDADSGSMDPMAQVVTMNPALMDGKEHAFTISYNAGTSQLTISVPDNTYQGNFFNGVNKQYTYPRTGSTSTSTWTREIKSSEKQTGMYLSFAGTQTPKAYNSFASHVTTYDFFSFQKCQEYAHDQINKLQYLTQEERDNYNKNIDAATTTATLDTIISTAKAQDDANNTTLKTAKQNAKDTINALKNLSDAEKSAFNTKVDNATTQGEITAIVNEAVAQDAANKANGGNAADLQAAKDAANKAIDSMQYLTDAQKTTFKGQVNASTTAAQVVSALNNAAAQDAINKANQDTNDQTALANAKTAAKAAIDAMPYLTASDKAAFKTSVEASMNVEEVSTALKNAQTKNDANKAALDSARSDAKATINNLKNLTTDQTALFNGEVDDATTQAQIDQVVNNAKAQDALNKAANDNSTASLNAAKTAAKAAVDSLPNLSSTEKAKFDAAIDAATTVPEVKAALAEAQAQDAINAGKNDSSAQALKNAQTLANAAIDALPHLTAAQKADYKAKVNAATTVSGVSDVLQDAITADGKAQDGLAAAKKKADNTIDALDNLTAAQKSAFKAQVDAATSTDEIDSIVAKAKAQDAINKANNNGNDTNLTAAKTAAKASIDAMPYLTSDQKTAYKADVDAQTTAAGIQNVLDQAQAQNDLNKANQDGDATALANSKKSADAAIDSLQHLNAAEKADAKANVEAAKTVAEVQKALDDAVNLDKSKVSDLAQAKKDAIKTVDALTNLTAAQKSAAEDAINAANTQDEIDAAVNSAKAQNAINAGNLDSAKASAKQAIDSLTNLSDAQKSNYEDLVDAATTVSGVQAALDQAKAQDAVEAAKNDAAKLQAAKDAANKAIDGMSYLTDAQKTQFKTDVNYAKTAADVQKALDSATAQNALNKAAADKTDAALKAAQTAANNAIDNLNLTDAQKSSYKDQVNSAKTTDEVAAALKDAQAESAINDAKNDASKLADAKKAAKAAVETLDSLTAAQKKSFEDKIDAASDASTVESILNDAKTQNENNKNALSQAKTEAKSKVAQMGSLSDSQKTDYQNQIDAATNTDQINAIVKNATAQNAIEAAKTDSSKLADAKTAAKDAIDSMSDLTDAQKNAFKNAVDSAKDAAGVQQVLDQANAQNDINKANSDSSSQAKLDAAKTAAKNSIDSMDSLTDAQKTAYKNAVDSAKSASDVQNVLSQAKAQNDINKAKSDASALDDAKTSAKTAINNMSNLTDAQKTAYKNAVDSAKSASDVQKALDQASAQDAINKAQNDATALNTAKTNAIKVVNGLDNLTQAQKDAYISAINSATDAASIQNIVDQANAQESINKASKDANDSSKSDSEKAASLQAAKDAAKKAIDSMSDLTDSQKTDLKNAIDKATSTADIQKTLDQAYTQNLINKSKNDQSSLQDAKDAAKKLVDELNSLTQAQKDAIKNAIDKASSSSDLQDVVDKAISQNNKNETDITNSKKTATNTVNNLTNLTTDEKNEIINRINNAKNQDEIDQIVKEATAQDSINKAEKDSSTTNMTNAKNDSKTAIDGMSNLTDKQKSDYKNAIDNAKTAQEILDILNQAKAQDAINKANSNTSDSSTLSDAKTSAKTAIDTMTDLTQDQKDAYEKAIDAAKTASDVQKILDEAKTQAAINKAKNNTSDSTLLDNAKTLAKSEIDNLSNLTADQKKAFEAAITAAKDATTIQNIIDQARAQDAINAANNSTSNTDALNTAKDTAKSAIDNLANLTQAQKDAFEKAVDAATSAKDVQAALNKAIAQDAINKAAADNSSKDSLQAAKDAANSAVDALTNLKPAEKTAAKNAINDSTTAAGVQKALNDAIAQDAIEAAKNNNSTTNLDAAKAAAKDVVAGLNALTNAQKAAANKAIDAATDGAGIEAALKDAKDLNTQNENALSDAKTAAKKTIAGLDSLTSAQRDAFNSAVDAATNTDEIDAVVAQAKAQDAINAAKNDNNNTDKLDAAKTAAKDAINKLPNLTDAQKKAFTDAVDAAKDGAGVQNALDQAKAQDAINKANNDTSDAAALAAAKTAIKGSIDSLPALTDAEKTSFKNQVDAAKTIDEANAVFAAAKAQNAIEAAKKNPSADTLKDAKTAAKTAISALPYLSSSEIDNFNNSVDAAKTIEGVISVLNQAQLQNAMNKANNAGGDTALKDAQTSGKAFVDALPYLSSDEKSSFDKQIDAAKSVADVQAATTAAQKQNDLNGANKDNADALAAAKKTAKETINGLKNLTDTHKSQYLDQVDAAKTGSEVSDAVNAAIAQDAIDAADKNSNDDTLKAAREAADKAIDQLSNLTQDQKDDFKDKVADAKDAQAISDILADAVKANNALNPDTSLAKAKSDAKTAIDNLTHLSDAEKTAAKAAVDKATTVDGVNAALKDAQDLDAKNANNGGNNNNNGGNSNNGGGSNGIVTPSSNTSSSSTSSSATTPSSTSQSGATSTSQEPSTSQIGKAVYATQKIYMYQNPTFKKSERVASFAKKPRLNRPMFVVTGTAKSSNGVARYKVRNVETNKTGYITANANFVSNVYYASVPAAKTVTVIAAKGVNAYKTVGLTGKAKHYKQGTVLKVTGIEKHNLTTRFKLSNGRYITANKKLVIGGKAAQATKVKTKKAIKVYSDANLTHAKKTIKKGKTISVKGYAYSRATSTKSFGTKRYQVSGGYITANSKYVSVVKTTR